LGAKYFYSSDDYTNLNVPKVKEFRRSGDCVLEGQIRNCQFLWCNKRRMIPMSVRSIG